MAAATYTDVDTGFIKQAVSNIRQNVDVMKGVRYTLKNQVLGKLEASWQGEARDLFFQQYRAFLVSFEQLVAEYEVLNAELDMDAREYQEADEMAMTLVAKLP